MTKAIQSFALRIGLAAILLTAAACTDKEPRPLSDLVDPAAQSAEPVEKGAAPVFQVASAPSGSVIRSGETVTGSLNGGDPVMDGRFYESWVFNGAPGTEVAIVLSSNDFDTYLRVTEDSGSEQTNDDGPDGTNSLLEVVMSGYELRIDASSFFQEATGSYSLTLATSASLLTINAGESVQGELEELDEVLENGSYYDLWSYSGRAGEVITVDVVSPDFDTQLSIRTAAPGSGTTLQEDDDGGEGYNSRITDLTLPNDGTYVFLVTSYEAAEGGYTLSVSSNGRRGGTEPGSGGDPNGKYALLVAVGDYPGTAYDLASSPVDVAAINDLLITRMGFQRENVLVLRDAAATREGIMNAFQTHLGQAGPGGMALFYYTGHGTQMSENLGLTAPLDPETDGKDEALAVWGEGGLSSVILDDELGFLSDQLLAERALILIDACFSGTGTRAAGSQSKAVDWGSVASKLALPGTYAGEDAWDDLDTADDQVRIDDMVFEGHQVQALSKGQFTFGVELWPNGIVPYVISPEIDPVITERFMEAIRQWEAGTSVRFIARTTEEDYVQVGYLPLSDSLSGGRSQVGIVGGPQEYSLHRQAGVGTMIHELGHTLGLLHEQTRGDRDRYVTVRQENVVSGYGHNFDKFSGNPCGEYNFSSVMHYPPLAFSANGQPTIQAKPQYASRQGEMGSRSMSRGDLTSVQMMYDNSCEAAPAVTGLMAIEGEPVQHVLISASDNDSEAWTSRSLEGQPQMMSVFTYFLDQTLRSANPSTSLQEIAEEVSRLTDAHNRQIGVPEQTPGAEGARKGQSLGVFLGLEGY